MANQNPFTQDTNAYQEGFTELFTASQDFEELDLNLDDATLEKMLITSLETDRDYWNQRPWKLQETDEVNTAFFLGDQLDDRDYLKMDSKYKDNRLFSSVRAILSYATAQLAKPDITPSKGDEVYLKGARDIGAALYQHAMDEKVDAKARAAVLNLITRKRGYMKLRWDPNLGLNGDICTEVCNPEDIIISRTAGYLDNPDKIYHRLRCTISELCAKFPDKQDQIYEAFNIGRGVFTQRSRLVTYYECWFTYIENNEPKEGVCWFINEKKLILDKMPNPNWVYLSSKKKERMANVTSFPPKPFVYFNYINLGHSFIDETCLLEQALPMQRMLNIRGRQIWENADYVNGRWIASKKSFNQEDAHKIINKGPKTVALVDADDVTKSFMNVAATPLPAYVENTLLDARNEVDQMMGTPSVFKGSQPDSQDTLGRDLMVKQQAGAMQDDLVRAIALGMEEYYKILLQMMRVYYTDDYWFQVKGGDGKFEFILINGDKFDTNVRVSVQTDSTLPLDKAMIRSTAMDLWNAGNAIDYRTLMEDLGLPNPDIRTERYLKSHLDPVNYLRSVELSQIDAEAETDIQLLIANKTPEERDDYSQSYFDYFNKFLTTNRFQKMQGDKNKQNPDGNPEAAQRITMFLAAIQHSVIQGLNMAETLDNAGEIPLPPVQPPTAPGQQPGAPAQPGQPALPGEPPQPPGNPVPPPQGPTDIPAAPPMSPPVPTQ